MESLARVCLLLHDAGRLALRLTFDSIHPPLSLAQHLQHLHVKTVLQKLRQHKIFSDSQWDKLYPALKDKQRRPRCVTSRDFDTKVLVVLLQTVCNLTPPYPNGWQTQPLDTDHSLAADIVRLQLTFTQAGAVKEVNKENDQTLWQKSVDILVRLAGLEVKN